MAWILPGAGDTRALDDELFGPEVAAGFRTSGGAGSLRERLWHEFEVADTDLLLEKTASSAFFPGKSTLPAELQRRGIDTVLITGTVTNVCCESSARDARTLGYRVVMVADANAARRDEDHNAALYTVYRSFGDVRSSGEVLDLLRAESSIAPHPLIGRSARTQRQIRTFRGVPMHRDRPWAYGRVGSRLPDA